LTKSHILILISMLILISIIWPVAYGEIGCWQAENWLFVNFSPTCLKSKSLVIVSSTIASDWWKKTRARYEAWVFHTLLSGLIYILAEKTNTHTHTRAHIRAQNKKTQKTNPPPKQTKNKQKKKHTKKQTNCRIAGCTG
jgi:hypothetical protein